MSDLTDFLDWQRKFRSANGCEPTPADAWQAAKQGEAPRNSAQGLQSWEIQGVWPFGKARPVKPAPGPLKHAAK